MKTTFKRLCMLAVPFMLASCGTGTSPIDSSIKPTPSSANPITTSSADPASSSATISSSELDTYRAVLPELRFTSDVAEEISFATTARHDDLDRPSVSGKFTLTNCDESLQVTDLVGTMKVRGNQTARWSKKAFAIKLDKKANLLGLNGGKKFKKWILLADAKDTTLIRSATGLYISKRICADDNQVWVADFTPVSVYLNDQYWGYYYLADQKEVKEGRVNLAEPNNNSGTDIGYCFEMDHYAEDEPKKADFGDPTFSIDYGNLFTRSSYNIENKLANFGPTTTFTMLSDITDGPSDAAINATNSAQVGFMKNRLQALWTVLGEAVVNNTAKTINENNEVVNSSESIQKVITDNFDLDAWADGFIINAFDCAPDVGYSSFYMSFDNTAEGAKKLRFDCPWDFDSNFGNRKDFIVTANTKSGNYDPYYMDRTSNMWLQYLGKLPFFMDIVKTKWNKLRAENAFEDMFAMMRKYFTDYDGEIQQNHKRWPVNDAATNYEGSFDEIRDPFKNVSDYKEAETETINWCAKRINYLDKKWTPEAGRPDINTNPTTTN